MQRIFIDVREPHEYANAHVEGALNIPPTDIMSGAPQLQNIPKDTELVLYCRSGSRSNTAMHLFKTLGFKNIVNGINKDHIRTKYF